MRTVGIALLVAVALFVLLLAASIARYPGGSWFDVHAVGHDLLRNFLCDLTQPVALNGARNPGAHYATTAMLVLDVGLLMMWLAIPALCPPSPLARWVRAAGVASSVGIFAVPFTPSLVHGLVHAAAVLTGALPGIAGGVLANVMLARSSHRRLYRLGLTILVVSAVDAALYVHHVVSDGPPVLALPAIQRAANVLLLSWMIAIAVTLLRQQRR